MEQLELFKLPIQKEHANPWFGPPKAGDNPWLGPPNLQSDYAVYIESEDWKKKAASDRELGGYRCELYEKRHQHLEVHHSSYRKLYQERWNDVEVLVPVLSRRDSRRAAVQGRLLHLA